MDVTLYCVKIFVSFILDTINYSYITSTIDLTKPVFWN